MHTPFRHPLATYSALDVLGYRRNGSPIYAIAGGSDEGAAGSASGQPSGGTPDPSGQPPAPPVPPAGDQGGQPSGPSGDETDWKALARQWEKRAKENKGAIDELAKIREQNMSDQEKAVAAAEKQGRTAAAAEYGAMLAAAQFETAVARAGIDLGDAADLIDTTRFVDKDGQVDTDGIKAAVTKLAKLAPRGPGRSGADLSGGSGDEPAGLTKQIAEAKAKGDWRAVMRLENTKLAAAEAAIK